MLWHRLVIGTVLSVLVSVSPASAAIQTAEELEALQGTWTVTAAESRGRPLDAIRGGTLRIMDDGFILRTAADNEFQGRIRVDRSASPPHLDFVHDDGTVWEAIYTVSGDVFRLNYVEAGAREGRPAIFATSQNSESTIVVLRQSPD